MSGFAQQRAQSTFDHVNSFNLNNAYAGLDSCIHVFAQRKHQWLGIDGAPINTQLQGYMPVARTWGVGLEVANWNAGLLNATNVAATLAKHLKISEKYTLSAALNVGYYQYGFGTEDVVAFDNDNYLNQSKSSNGGIYGDFGILLSSDKLELGVALPRVFGTRPSFEIGSEANEFDVERYLNAHASYRLTLNGNFDLIPMVIYRSIPSNGAIVDVKAGLMYRNMVGVNIGYRTNNGLIGAIDVTISDRFKLGYAYDAGMTQLNGVSNGSHEFLLGFQLCKERKKEDKVKSEISGVTTDQKTGEPISDMAITVENLTTQETETVKTNSKGEYKLKTDPETSYKLTAAPEGYEPVSQVVEADPRIETMVTNLALVHKEVSAKGLVIDGKTGAPLADVSIVLSNGSERYQAITDADGMFSVDLDSKRPGDAVNYNITMSKPGYEDGSEEFTTTIADYEGVNLSEGNDGFKLMPAVKVEPVPSEVVEDDRASAEPKSEPEPKKTPVEPIQFAPIAFEFNSAEITELAIIRLNKVVKVMNQNPDMKVRAEAHTDCKGGDALNLALSNKRAKASVNYIKSRIKNPERITGKGFGETQPLSTCECENCPEEALAKNRRTEFIVVE